MENQPRQRRSGEDAQRAQYPNYVQYGGFDRQGAAVPPQPQDTRRRCTGNSSYRRGKGDGLWLAIIIACIALLIIGGFWVNGLYSHYPAFRDRVQALQTDTFLDGVHVDGIHLGGMTMEQARQALATTNEEQAKQFALPITLDGKTWTITQNELPLERNTEGVLEEAFSIGRQNSYDAQQQGMTPFAYRSQSQQSAGSVGAFLYTRVTYDKSTVRTLCDKLSAWVSSPAQNATVSSFDFSTRSFQYIQERDGTFLSSDEIYDAVTQHLDTGNYERITLSTHPQQATVTVAQLQQNFGLIASYSTDTLPDRNRNKNIELACNALNGTVLDSGKTLSFNEITGRRTVDKGYLMAGAIAQGRSYEEAGGGVCQVSSTLFNAAVMANMKIITSSPHAWPSAYVEPGRDATVDWQGFQRLEDSLDLKIQNTSSFPMFIRATVSNTNTSHVCLCTVEIYGISLGEGTKILLETELEGGEPIPSPTPKRPEYLPLDETHPEPTVEVLVKGREGYKYKTYRVFYQYSAEAQDYVETRRELIRTSYYKPYAEQVRIYGDETL